MICSIVQFSILSSTLVLYIINPAHAHLVEYENHETTGVLHVKIAMPSWSLEKVEQY